MEATYLTLTVPPGAEPGVDSLSFQYQGQELEILVPSDAKEGDVLQVQVGSGGKDGGAGSDQEEVDEGNKREEKLPSGLLDELGGIKEDDESKPAAEEKKGSGVTTVFLGLNSDHPASLHLLDSLPTKNNGAKVNGQSDGDGTNAMVWPSGLLLAQTITSPSGIEYMSKYIDSTFGIYQRFQVQCLELGSGLGVCGLAMVHALISTEDPVDFHFVLTDHGEEAINLLNENIERNQDLFSSRLCTVKAEKLKWGDVLKLTRLADIKFHIILGSDLLYNTQDTYQPLLHTMVQHLDKDGFILLGVRWRKPDLEREFFSLALEMGLEFVLWEEVLDTSEFKARCPCRLGWREYGDPKCQASNHFFQETMVSISNSKIDGKGKEEKSLAEINESDMEGMSEDEYTMFEELQIQIYVGRFVDKKEAPGDAELIAKKRSIDDISS